MRWAGHVEHMGEEKGVYRVLVGKLEGKRPLGRPRRRWVDNIALNGLIIRPLQTKRRVVYLKPQSVPRCKHFSSRL